MKVRATKPFTGRHNGRMYHVRAGDELEMPEAVDWLRAGLVQAIEPAEKAVTPEPRKRSTKAEPVTAIKGIGRKTAEELGKLGIQTVPQLAAADSLPDELLQWQEAAQKHLR